MYVAEAVSETTYVESWTVTASIATADKRLPKPLASEWPQDSVNAL